MLTATIRGTGLEVPSWNRDTKHKRVEMSWWPILAFEFTLIKYLMANQTKKITLESLWDGLKNLTNGYLLSILESNLSSHVRINQMLKNMTWKRIKIIFLSMKIKISVFTQWHADSNASQFSTWTWWTTLETREDLTCLLRYLKRQRWTILWLFKSWEH